MRLPTLILLLYIPIDIQLHQNYNIMYPSCNIDFTVKLQFDTTKDTLYCAYTSG